MARLYADENFPREAALALRALGHDVVTAVEARMLGKTDPEVLAFATSAARVTLTQDRRDFIRFHLQGIKHAGIIACTSDPDFQALANRIHEQIRKEEPLEGKLVRVIRPNTP